MSAPRPVLFERVGRDWRWAHDTLLDAWVHEAARALPLLPAEPSARVLQVLGPPGLALWALDRAARDGGWTVWTGRESISGPIASRSIRVAGSGLGHETTHVWAPSGDPARYPAPSRTVSDSPVGGVLLRGQGALQTWTEPQIAERVAALRSALQAGISADRPGLRGADVVLLHDDWNDPGTRRVLAWAEDSGAAILFEPEPAWAFSSLVWARPTRIFASSAEFRLWEPLLATRSLRDWTRRRGPFARLRTLIVRSAPSARPVADPRAGSDEDPDLQLPRAWLDLLSAIDGRVLHAS